MHFTAAGDAADRVAVSCGDPAHGRRTHTKPRGAVFGLIEEMQAVNTDGIEPMSHGIDVTQRLRPDAVTETDHRADNLAPAGNRVENGLYLVPKVIE